MNSGNSKIRLKALVILKSFFERFSIVMENHHSLDGNQQLHGSTEELMEDHNLKTILSSQENNRVENMQTTGGSTKVTDSKDETIQFLDYKRFLVIKVMTQVLKTALENNKDSKLQFNALLLLDQHFQTVFLGAPLKSELELCISTRLKQKSPKCENII